MLKQLTRETQHVKLTCSGKVAIPSLKSCHSCPSRGSENSTFLEEENSLFPGEEKAFFLGDENMTGVVQRSLLGVVHLLLSIALIVVK